MAIKEISINAPLTYNLLRAKITELHHACGNHRGLLFNIESNQSDLMSQDAEALAYFLAREIRPSEDVKLVVKAKSDYLRNMLHVLAAYCSQQGIELQVVPDNVDPMTCF